MLAFLHSFILLAAEGASGESGYDNFLHFWNTYFNYPGFELWRFLNLAIFVAIMIYLLRKPLSGAFKAKRDAIRAELIRAEEERQAALAQLTKAEARLAGLETESNAVYRYAQEEATNEKQRIAEQAEFEARRLREQADGEIERVGKLAKLELRRFSAEESVRLAEEKIKNQITAEKDSQLIKANIQAIGGLN